MRNVTLLVIPVSLSIPVYIPFGEARAPPLY